jgi:hypothetical protein
MPTWEIANNIDGEHYIIRRNNELLIVHCCDREISGILDYLNAFKTHGYTSRYTLAIEHYMGTGKYNCYHCEKEFPEHVKILFYLIGQIDRILPSFNMISKLTK